MRLRVHCDKTCRSYGAGNRLGLIGYKYSVPTGLREAIKTITALSFS